jgi:hypothetical protein
MLDLVRQAELPPIGPEPCAMRVIGSAARATGVFVAVWIAALGFAAMRDAYMMTHRHLSKADIAQLTAKRLAYEAFPSWAAAHPDRSCPISLEELGEYMDHGELRDAWGRNYYFACGPLMLPRTAVGIWVLSAGEDGQFGTADDVRSDR